MKRKTNHGEFVATTLDISKYLIAPSQHINASLPPSFHVITGDDECGTMQ